MQGFKSLDSRLARLFKNSREQWRTRAAEKQKKMRGMEVKIRDLSASREQWKEKALAAQEEQEKLERELEDLKKKLNSQNLR
jgi:chromosome segregation ATPase